MNIIFNSEQDSDSQKRLKAPEWDLSDLYKGFDDKQIEADFLKVEKSVKEFVSNYQGKVINLKENEIIQAVKKYEEIGELSSKLASFAYLHKAKNSTDEKIAIFYQNTIDRLSKAESELLFFSLEINKIDENTI